MLSGLGVPGPPGGLAERLRSKAAGGIRRRGDVLMWTDSTADADNAPGGLPDLTGWECHHSSFHLEDFIRTSASDTNGQPSLSEDDQRLLLLHGVALAREVGQAVYALEPPIAVHLILSANATCATFRFHQIRAGERWEVPDLDSYRFDKVVSFDIAPTDLA